MSAAPEHPVRPRRVALTRDDVVQAAVALTAEQGLSAVTLRAVAQDLGVRSPSLYHHVPGGVDELRRGVVEALVSQIERELDEEPSEGLSLWQAVSRPLVRVGRLADEYPGVVQHMLVSGREEATMLRGADRFVAMVLDSELRDRAPAALLLFHTYVNGWVHARRPTPDAARELGLDVLAGVLEQANALDAEAVLLQGLRALLDGLLAELREA